MTARDEFYHWWSGLTNDERVDCWYDLDAMAHGEVVSNLRLKLSQAQAEIVVLRRCVEASDALTSRLATEPLEFATSRGKHNINLLEALLAGYDRARAAVGKVGAG